ncbi:hypothetical protein [Oleiharenicola lentus]|uniref:hypothetical protein n=1 Tax=Oleiharenicola lentus TaxID=2508720 RepID=UPI003F665A75
MIGVWFGNFFEPFYSDRAAVERGIAEVAELGFTSLNLDSKPWEDFFARYRGEPASQYVGMQEFMIQQARSRGLDYTHLALYLCGDNLYPTIRDVPPVRGEEAILPDGKPMGTYKYWSPAAQKTMVDHVAGLLKLYGNGMFRRSDDRIVMQTMFDPIPKPSFDEEGRSRYLAWLEKRYSGDVTKLNEIYGIKASTFYALTPDQYWLRPKELNWVECAVPSAQDFEARTADFHRWIDNQTYLASEMESYFATMKEKWRELEPKLFIEPVLHQWGYFFNPPGQTIWPTAKRALDVYRLAPHVDGVLYITSPLNAENRADAMAVSVEGSILRTANQGREFTAGLYLGRHVNGDIYSVVPPSEAIATLVASGAGAFHMYGYSGLDDGGVLFRMDGVFKESLSTGNRWAKEVIPLIDEARSKEVAILFPREMSLYEPLEHDVGGRHRMDLLGWYSQFVDLGWHVDILHPDQVEAGGLAGYETLVVSHNSLYDLGDNSRLEIAVKSFVEAGGTLFHGPKCALARRAFGIEETTTAFDCFEMIEEVIPHGWSTVEFAKGNQIARYLRSGRSAIAETSHGAGRVISFGFEYGYAYTRTTMPIVPPEYGKREMHPIVLLKQTPVELLAGAAPKALFRPIKGVECARFGRHVVIVNHRSSPVNLGGIIKPRAIHQTPSAGGWLAAHSALYLDINS